MTEQGQNMADWVDSNILVDIYKAGRFLDKEPVPLMGRYFWNPETNKVEPVPETKEIWGESVLSNFKYASTQRELNAIWHKQLLK